MKNSVNRLKDPSIAIATSGFGHVFRGMEGWAESMAATLDDTGYPVTLFGGGKVGNASYHKMLPCIRRGSRLAQILCKLGRFGGWRFGLGSPGQLEAWTFGLFLLFHLRKGYSLVHIKQGNLASFLNLAKKLKLLKIPYVLSNGQIANSTFIDRIEYVQFLSHLEKEQMVAALGEKASWFVVPNFVDTKKFKPMGKEACRRELSIPENSFVVLTVGAIKSYHKRMDYFLYEMGRLKSKVGDRLHVVMAGSKDRDSSYWIDEGKRILGNQLTVFTNLPKDAMPVVYNVADVFALCSLKEAFGNVYIEAMACGVPVIHNNYPVTEWIVDKGGVSTDLSMEGNLEKTVVQLIDQPEEQDRMKVAGRMRAQAFFSKEAILEKTREMYHSVKHQYQRDH